MKDIWKEYEPNLGFKRINRKKIIITIINYLDNYEY